MSNSINENHEYIANGKIDIDDPQVLVTLNAGLSEVTAVPCMSPYNAWARVQKVLAAYHIFIPNSYLEGSIGHEVLPLNQFGKRFGQTNDGDFVVRDETDLYLYFEWEMTLSGKFKIFTEVVNGEDLNRLLADFDDDVAAVNEASELAKGIKDEAGEHGMSKSQAKKTAKDHLKKDPKYYSKLDKIGLEEKAPPGREKQVLKLKKKFGDKSSSPYAIAWAQYKKKKIEEAKKMKGEDPCWDGYEMVGKKKKNGKEVPNCVPVSEATDEEKRQKRLQRWVPKPKKKKLGKNAELVAGWADEIKQVRASMQKRNNKKLDEANSKNTLKIKLQHYTRKGEEMTKDMQDRSGSSNPVRRSMMNTVYGRPGSTKSKKAHRKLKLIRKAADTAKRMLKTQ